MTGSGNSSNITTVTVLPLPMCGLLNLPSGHLECVTKWDAADTQCLSCALGSSFSSGEGLDDYYSRGHVTLLLINGIAAMVGVIGAFMNCLIVAVLRRQNSGKSFDILLSALGGFDMFVCVMSPLCAASASSWYQNWNRSQVPLFGIYFSANGTLAAKTGSSFLTIIIAAERLVALSYPFSARRWFTHFKTKMLVALVCLYTVVKGLAHFSCTYIGKNGLDPGIESTKRVAYLAYRSPLGCLVRPFDLFDIFVPIPVLLFLNGLMFRKIRQISAQRKELTSSQRSELRAGEMVLPVVAVLIICSIAPIAMLLVFFGKAPIEIMTFGYSFHTLNSAVNFPIYFWNSATFRGETKALLAQMGQCCAIWKRKKKKRTARVAAAVLTPKTSNEPMSRSGSGNDNKI